MPLAARNESEIPPALAIISPLHSLKFATDPSTDAHSCFKTFSIGKGNGTSHGRPKAQHIILCISKAIRGFFPRFLAASPACSAESVNAVFI